MTTFGRLLQSVILCNIETNLSMKIGGMIMIYLFSLLICRESKRGTILIGVG